MKIKLFLFSLIAMLSMGCVAYADPPLPPTTPSYGCVVVEDAYGEREVCDVQYYIASEGVIYFDPFFHLWVGSGGYWGNGIWHYGYFPQYYNRYHTFYHTHGYFGTHATHGYYGNHFNGGHNTFHGHFGGGGHGGGGSHGGHGGHR